MGKSHQTAAHAKRTPNMSPANLWQQELKRIAITASLLFAIVFGSIQWIVHQAANKPITLIVDGQQMNITTRSIRVADLLQEQQLVVGIHDRLSTSLNSEISRGDTIMIDRVIPVHLRVDGVSKLGYTSGRTVQAALEDLQIVLGENDLVTPNLNATITAHSHIKVTRLHTELAQFSEEIPYDVITQQDDQLDKGKLRLVQEGQKGELVTRIKRTFADGYLVSEEIINESTVRPSMDEIVAVGTKNPVMILSASSPDVDVIEKDGMSFGVKQVLEDVTLTAYHAGYSSTGKTEDHPQYGKTYSGTTVEEGRTVAVDPKVIPMGWWVYIEGVGLRKAEDIGSAIKGKIIDVYMESENEANRFGRKRGHTVYVVGPNKPSVQ